MKNCVYFNIFFLFVYTVFLLKWKANCAVLSNNIYNLNNGPLIYIQVKTVFARNAL